jgi:hypothetical protein
MRWFERRAVPAELHEWREVEPLVIRQKFKARAALGVFLILTGVKWGRHSALKQAHQTRGEVERSTASDGMWNTDPELPLNEILNNIKSGTVKSTAGGPSISYMLAPFSALLVRLSRDAEVAGHRIEVLTWRLYVLTIALLVLTSFLVFKEIYDIFIHPAP